MPGGLLQRFTAVLRNGRIKRYVSWLIKNTRPYIGTLLFFLAVDITAVALTMGSVIISKEVVDTASAGGLFGRGFMLMVILTAANIAAGAVSSLLSTLLTERYAFFVRIELYEKILRSEWQRLSSFHSGDILTRVTSDAESVTSGITYVFPGAVTLIIRLAAAFIILYYHARPLAVISLILGPAGVLLTFLFGRRLKSLSVMVKESEAKYRSFIQESVEGAVAIKAFRSEERSAKRLSELRGERLKSIIERNKLGIAMSSSVGAVYAIGYLCAMIYGLYGLSSGVVTFGTITLMLSLVSQVQEPIMSLAGMVPAFIEVLASAGRIMEIEDIGAEKDNGAADTYNLVGLRYKNISFGYTDDEVLKEVNLDIAPGKVLGILGESGAGKTTLVRLALALINPDSGQVIFYHAGGDEPASAASRRHIAYVPQGISLLSGTVADSLREGKPDATDAEMWQALEQADAAGFVGNLPDGLNSVMPERAAGFSEGQAQRIAIARALIKNAPVLILDEATSALDSETENRILSQIVSSRQNTTCLIITHRRSMLEYCSAAIEIKCGKINRVSLDQPENG